VLLDDREQVTEQPALDRGQLRALDRLVRLRVLYAIDRWTRGRDPARSAPAAVSAGAAVSGPVSGGVLGGVTARAILRAAAGYTLVRRFALLRYLRPSSYRFA
jgi:hypothetical protein